MSEAYAAIRRGPKSSLIVAQDVFQFVREGCRERLLIHRVSAQRIGIDYIEIWPECVASEQVCQWVKGQITRVLALPRKTVRLSEGRRVDAADKLTSLPWSGMHDARQDPGKTNDHEIRVEYRNHPTLKVRERENGRERERQRKERPIIRSHRQTWRR